MFRKKFILIIKKSYLAKDIKFYQIYFTQIKNIIKVKDINIVFNLRSKGKSKMNIKVLINIIFIFFNFYRKLSKLKFRMIYTS